MSKIDDTTKNHDGSSYYTEYNAGKKRGRAESPLLRTEQLKKKITYKKYSRLSLENQKIGGLKNSNKPPYCLNDKKQHFTEIKSKKVSLFSTSKAIISKNDYFVNINEIFAFLNRFPKLTCLSDASNLKKHIFDSALSISSFCELKLIDEDDKKSAEKFQQTVLQLEEYVLQYLKHSVIDKEHVCVKQEERGDVSFFIETLFKFHSHLKRSTLEKLLTMPRIANPRFVPGRKSNKDKRDQRIELHIRWPDFNDKKISGKTVCSLVTTMRGVLTYKVFVYRTYFDAADSGLEHDYRNVEIRYVGRAVSKWEQPLYAVSGCTASSNLEGWLHQQEKHDSEVISSGIDAVVNLAGDSMISYHPARQEEVGDYAIAWGILSNDLHSVSSSQQNLDERNIIVFGNSPCVSTIADAACGKGNKLFNLNGCCTWVAHASGIDEFLILHTWATVWRHF